MSAPDRPPWMFDESRDFGFSDAAQVASYERGIAAKPADHRDLLTALGVTRDHTLIDFGCGTGGLAIEAAKLCRHVTAVDVSAAMIHAARENAAAAGVRNIDFVQSGFLTYEHGAEHADFAVSVHALHHLPDFWKVAALRRIAASLRPGGVFYLHDIVYSFDPVDYERAITAWIDRVAADGTRPGLPRPFFEEHVREEYSTYSWLLEPMLNAAGFDIRSAEYRDTQAYATYTCARR